MVQAIHPSYLLLLDEMENRNCSFTSPRLETPFQVAGKDFSLPRSLLRGWLGTMALIFGIAVGVSIGGYFVFERQTPMIPPAIAATPAREDSTAKELELVKQILVGLVGTVEKLSLGQEAKVTEDVTTEREPEKEGFPVKVKVERANLRERPQSESKSIMIVPKDTELLGILSNDGWIEVTTPLGGEAWINSALVTEFRRE